MIGSCVGERAMTPGLVAYSATKGAVKMFTQGLSREVAHVGHRLDETPAGRRCLIVLQRLRVRFGLHHQIDGASGKHLAAASFEGGRRWSVDDVIQHSCRERGISGAATNHQAFEQVRVGVGRKEKRAGADVGPDSMARSRPSAASMENTLKGDVIGGWLELRLHDLVPRRMPLIAAALS